MIERVIPPPKAHRGQLATDDHVAGPAPGARHQPTTDLDPSTDDEHLSSSSQGVRPADAPADGAAGGGPGVESESGSGPADDG